MNDWNPGSSNGIETTLRSPVGDIVYQRDSVGRLFGIRYGDRIYLERRGSWAVWDEGFARWREERTPDGVTRTVEAASSSWTENYRWDESDRLVHIDGVDIRRDEQGRVIACYAAGEDPADEDHRWFYHYEKNGLASVASPAGTRVISQGADGRPIAWAGADRGQCRYDAEGHRRDVPAPLQLLRDAGGRVWAELDAEGAIVRTYLWDGHRCLARIDGPLGDRLAAVFSLDPSGTPVRAIFRDHALRLPRDAYGESLLAHADVPGLFGGFQADGFVHLPWRSLDPRIGAFTAPDPFDGGEDDPRRGPSAEFKGGLTVEAGSPSPYAVARHDPVGRTDPTGAISGLMLLSDFTWSWQNNLLSFFGLDWWFNLVLSLVTGFQYGDFGSSEVLTASDRIGAGAIRRDGFMRWISFDQGGTPAFATQHIIWAPASEFEDTERGWVIDPRGEFRPTLYGTLLKAEPSGQPPFLLRGMRNPGNAIDASRNWTRQGGTAAFAAPNLPLPIFPSGGFHLAGNPLPYSGNRDCPLTELDPGGELVQGTFEQRAEVTIAQAAGNPNVGNLALLSDGAGAMVLTPIVSVTPEGTNRRLRLEDDAPAIGPLNVSVELIDQAPASSEARAAPPAAVDPGNSLTAIGTGTVYASGDLLRLTAATDEVTIARVDRLEAQLQLNAPLPGGLAAPIVISRMRAAANGPNGVMVDGTTVDFTGAAPPAAGTLGIVVTPAGTDPEPVRIVDASNLAAVTLDTDISGTHAPAADVQFRPATVQGDLGRRTDPPEAAAVVTYTPNAAGAAPDGAAGTVLVRASGGGTEALRQVTAAPVYDVIVLDRAPVGADPWTVDRLRRLAGSSVQDGVTIERALAFVSPDSNRLDGADALRLLRVDAVPGGGAPDARAMAELAGLTFTPAAGEALAFAEANLVPPFRVEPRPGQPVILRQGAADTLAVVSRMRLTVTLDRAIADLPVDGMECLPLGADGPTYSAELRTANSIILDPEVQLAAGGVAAADFARIRVGEAVQVTEGGNALLFRVEAVDGGRLDLDMNSALAGAAGDPVSVQRMLPLDVGNGHWLSGRNGERIAGNRIRFDVTNFNALPADTDIGVISDGQTHPATVVAGNQDVQALFAADPGLAAGSVLDLHGLIVVGSEDVARFTREDQALVATVGMAAPAAGANEVALAQAFVASPCVAADARLNPGMLLVPNDEGHAVDRRQAFVDHELTHTIQYAQWGPLWFCYFPMILLELPVELTTDIELPDYGPFVTGTVEAVLGQWHLTVADRATLQAGEGDILQIVQGARIRRVKVVSIDPEKIVVQIEDSGAVAPPTGNVHIRRIQDEAAWEGVHSALQLFTHGGLLNITAGSTWSGLIWLIVKGIYGIVTAIKGTGDLYQADVQANGAELRLTNDAGRQALNSTGRFIVKQGPNVVVREGTVNDGVITVTPPVSFITTVMVGRYDTQNPDSVFDWLNYYPGTVADAANPYAVTLPGNGSRFHALDRVEVSYQAQSFRSTLTAVNGDVLQLQDPVPLQGTETSVRVADVDVTGSTDATGNWDSAAMTELGMGWMKWVFDPWGQFDRKVDFENEYVNLIPRVARYLFGTQMYSLLPFLGYVFYGRFFRAEHLAKIEQLASGESGELYTPLSRITGQVRATDGYASYRMLVGDIARFRFWTNRVTRSLIDRSRQMEPGVFPDEADLRAVVFRDDTAVAAGEPNGTTESGPGPGATPARAGADLFSAKPAGDPLQLDPGVTDPTGLAYTALAQVPEHPAALRHRSVYMAFTQPGQHRLTTVNDIDSNDESREAREVQEIERQSIFFDVEAMDVTVTLAGQTVNAGSTINLLPMQRATATIAAPENAPSGPRRWRLTVRRPDQGDRLRQPGDLVLQTRAVLGAPSPVELSRYYPWNEESNSYADGGLQRFGLHLGGDVDIPVRRFLVNVVNTFPLRATADASAAAADRLAQGVDGFLLVPSPVVAPPVVGTFGGRAHAPGAGGDPEFVVANVTPVPEAARPLVGAEGRLYRISFAAAPALPAAVSVRIDLTVGEAAGPQAEIRCTFDLTPP